MADVLELHVNGAVHRVDAARRPLLEVLRDELGLCGCKYGCGEGQCGACTVIIDGVAVRSCTTMVGSVAGKEISTIEGLAASGKLHPLQQAFLDHGAMQCGYCTPGMIMAGAALLKANPNPDHQTIVEAMQGNICRCGTYTRIMAAIRQAAQAAEEAAS
jgi:aerobic-type carbon monoxide dehydrogenase small subunit (CoxS/CutS family)